MKEVSFSAASIISSIEEFSQQNITELYLHDKNCIEDRQMLEKLIGKVKSCCPDLFLSLPVSPKVIDHGFVKLLDGVYCSLEIDLCPVSKNEKLLFDKKMYSSKAKILNDAGIVFGFNMDFGLMKGDTFKLFRDRLDFALSLYPNHVDFAQLEGEYSAPKPTGVFSSKDIDFARGIAFACKVFYTLGRAVPWFNPVLNPLKISPSTFLADFEEWQQCNNCSFESGFDTEKVLHPEVEKMQIRFLEQKYEEKNKDQFFGVVSDLVRLNGAFSRVSESGESEVVETSYNPDDLLSPYSLNISSFADNVTQEFSSTRIFATEYGIDYKIL